MHRNITAIFHFILDELVPPFIRDSRVFMWIPFRLLFGKKDTIFLSFKDNSPYLSKNGIRDMYIETASVHIQRETDINSLCLQAIAEHIVGKRVLDIACGRGFLSKILSERFEVTGADILVDQSMARKIPQVRFLETDLEYLPFEDNCFDTVVSTHTLEHIIDFSAAVKELRRVAKKRLIIVVPRQRAYKYTFDLHIHFFPYAWSLINAMRPPTQHVVCKKLGADWLYIEDVS